MDFDTDIVVAGGGLNGLSTALALASGGFSVTVVDPLARKLRADAGQRINLTYRVIQQKNRDPSIPALS